MPLPEYNEYGDLPDGRHSAPLDEVTARFGLGTPQRVAVTDRLQRIHDLALKSGHLDQFVIFGSYVSDKAEPNDVDVILVMRNDFTIEHAPAESRVLFDHTRADAELGASVFWVRPDMLFGESLEQFLATWERKRDGHLRGIVEVQL